MCGVLLLLRPFFQTRFQQRHAARSTHPYTRFDHSSRTPRRYPYDVPREDTRRLWERIECPVLIVNSKQGYAHRMGQGDTLRHFRDVRLVEVEDAGHWTHHDQLETVLGVVEEFV